MSLRSRGVEGDAIMCLHPRTINQTSQCWVIQSNSRYRTNDPLMIACVYIVVKFHCLYKDSQGMPMLKLRGVAVARAVSSHLISDVQLSTGKDMEYGSVISTAKHSRALPIYINFNL